MQLSKNQVEKILKIIKRTYPDAKCALDHSSPLQLLIATILSAQCTDVRVNMVTPALFRRYPSAKEFSRASLANIQKLIHSTGFYRNKAKNIKEACRRIVHYFDGEVPKSMEDLRSLPGVARKTANVVLGNSYGLISGIVVDTHVFRIAHRLGLTAGKNPEKVEQDLMKIIPRKEWINFSHRLINHGRRVCSARRPCCSICTLEMHCLKIGVTNLP